MLWLAAGLGLALMASWAPTLAQADDFPNRPISLVVPYPPAGVLDTVARIIADGMSKKLGRPVIILNKVGGGGAVGMGYVAHAAPDGYTLLMGNEGSNAILPFADPNFRFDPYADFTPITIAVEYSHALMVNAKTPSTTVQGFVDYARARPGELTYGTPGYGSTAQLAMELFMKLTATQMIHVPYRGSALALTDLMAGMITSTLQSMTGVIPQIGAKETRILAVTGSRREEALPDTPTMIESGLPDLVVTSWLGLFSPPDTPLVVRAKLDEAIREAARAPMAAETIAPVGTPPRGARALGGRSLLQSRTRLASLACGRAPHLCSKLMGRGGR